MSQILESLTKAIRTFERQGGTFDEALGVVKDVFKRRPRRGESEFHQARNDDIAARLRAGESFSDVARWSGLGEGRIRQIARSRGIATNTMIPASHTFKERNERIVLMRQAGMRKSDIAKAVGLSGTRVSQIIWDHERLVRRLEAIRKVVPPVVVAGDTPAYEWAVNSGLSVRTTNCIRNMYPPPTLDDLRKMSDVQLIRIPNFGRKSFNELRAALLKGVKPHPLA